jgi:ribosomal protein S15P/S13E
MHTLLYAHKHTGTHTYKHIHTQAHIMHTHIKAHPHTGTHTMRELEHKVENVCRLAWYLPKP